LVAAACGLAVSALAEHFSKVAIFVLIAAMSSCALLTVRWMPSAPSTTTPEPGDRGETPLWIALSLGGSISFFYFTPIAALWAYVTEIGILDGADARSVEATVSGGLLVAGLAGSLAAAFPFLRKRPHQVVALASAGGAALVELLLSAPGPSIYAVSVPAFVFLWFLAYPLTMAILSTVDPTGRLAMSGALLQTVAFAVGPLVGGALFDRHAYTTFGVACCISFTCACACVVAIRRIVRPDAKPA
jgi:predicted MFS family arabinose efflux permease